jgi:hypothetical protein
MSTGIRSALGFTLAGVIALAGCGGGTDGTGAPAPTAQVTSSGILTQGSTILNGTRFDDSTAVVTDDSGRGAAQLGTGMFIKLRGRSDDGVGGQADRIDIENEVRGTIQNIDAAAKPQRFMVAGLTVLVDGKTVYSNVAGFAALAVPMRVEVHGLRDNANNVRASRVEVLGPAGGADELRGAVSDVNMTANQFTLNGTIAVHYAGATFRPTGASEAALTPGTIVEVRGTLTGTVFAATEVDIEDLEDVEFRGSEHEKQEIEGFISGFTAHPGTFQINSRSVQTTPTTQFAHGTAANLANNVKAEAEGTINAQGVLVAAKIAFEKARVTLHGLATAVNVPVRTVVVLGQTVQANDLTRIEARDAGGSSSNLLQDVTPMVDCVEIRAFMNGSTVVAEAVKEPSACGKARVQAHVTGENETAFTLTYFGSAGAGLDAALGGAGVQFRDSNGLVITRTEFFADVVSAGAGRKGSLVKVTGTLTAGVLVAETAELVEDD